MGLFSAAASAGTWTLEKLGLGWVTGLVPITEPFTAISTGKASLVPITITFPEYIGTSPTPTTQFAFLNLVVPNHSTQFGEIALNMAQNALNMLELVVAFQQVVDEEGGLRIKDQLDPYHFEVIKNALEENGETVPPVTEPNANVLSQLGGEITELGLLGGIGPVVDAMRAAGQLEFLTIAPQVSTYPSVINFNSEAGGAPTAPTLSSVWAPPASGFPDYEYPLQIMNSAVAIQGLVTSYAVGIFRNAVDTESRALLLKGVLSEFGKAVSDNAIEDTGGTPPEWEEPTGQSGVF